jgi:hypothetical protein
MDTLMVVSYFISFGLFGYTTILFIKYKWKPNQKVSFFFALAVFFGMIANTIFGVDYFQTLIETLAIFVSLLSSHPYPFKPIK